MLTIRKKGYYRKPYTRSDGTKVKGTYVKPTTYQEVDRGKSGRGKKVLPELKEGTLGIDFSKSDSYNHSILEKKAKKIGEKKVMGKLQALNVLFKNTNPKYSNKAKKYERWVAQRFKGKKRVRAPKGLSKNY
jgi:hypothetical protein